jgi:hypothetical protein
MQLSVNWKFKLLEKLVPEEVLKEDEMEDGSTKKCASFRHGAWRASGAARMAYYIQHKTDADYPKWYAGTYEYAQRLLKGILEARAELREYLEIVEV